MRRPDPDDQRVSRVYLTEAGRAVQGRVQAVWDQMEAETFAGFTPEERVLLRRFLLQLRREPADASGRHAARMHEAQDNDEFRT